MNLARPLIQLGQNIIAGTRAALFMPVHLWCFKGGYLQIVLLLFITLALTFLDDYLETAPNNVFNPYGLGYEAMLYLLFFFSLSLIAYLNSRLNDLNKLIVLFLSIAPVIWLGTMCLLYLSQQQNFLTDVQASWSVFILYLIWYLLIVFRLIKRFFYLSVIKAVVFMSLHGVVNITPLFLLPKEPLWYSTQISNPVIDKYKLVDIETAYYSQAGVLKETMADIYPGRDNEIDLYFIGFAGDAKEDVFMNEVKAAKDIMDSRFGTLGRSVLLVNNVQTINSYPLANRYNLAASIKKIASLMDKENDVMFLFLTSHGTEDHKISANFPGFQFKNLGAEMINTLLDEAGIKWRIIIISACYSGGLINTLANPNTLLITAASADRASFGCGHDGQFTYFGQAYFGESLKKTDSFIEAFEASKQLIYERENKEGFSNSEPQLRLGEEMKHRLLEFQKQLQSNKSFNWAYTKED
ncbi:MAG: C13 family peptidase [Proteobacteria bacterium]|nr:C13 family peptidase [Pseudomonadota bacterium]